MVYSKKRDLQTLTEAARDLGIPVTYLDKGTLNSLSSNRPSSGVVLRTRKFSLSSTRPGNVFSKAGCLETSPQLWVALDEIMDPQNLGTILRSSYFLSGGKVNTAINVLLCDKNSAPLSPVVSAASAGALEISEILGTNNMPAALLSAKEAGWRVLGAAAENPLANSDVECLNFDEYDPEVPTVLVLGNEGSGLRTMVAKSCDGFVRIEGGERNGGEGGGVDSLNVSVSAGILMSHFGASRKNRSGDV
jgi:21S rRNA (GM2251-2'-O)-methyltransferase